MSGYLATYRGPFDATIAPLRGADPRDDDFRQTSPQFKVAGLAVPGFVALEKKWLTWDPANVIALACVDPVRQMMILKCSGAIKAWAGMVQKMPVPTLVGTALEATIEYTVYGKTVCGDVATDGEHEVVHAGLVLGEDLIGMPDTSQLIAAGLTLYRQISTGGDMGGGGVVGSQCAPSMSQFVTYDAPALPAYIATGLCTQAYTRARVRASVSRESTGEPLEYETDVWCDLSFDGVGWLRMATANMPAPIMHAGFGIQSNSALDVAMFLDLFRVDVHQGVDDLLKAVGGSDIAGAV